MQLEKIISISGKPGLFKLISQLKNGFIVEDITTKKKLSIGNTSQVSLLDNVAMFTTDSEVPLFDVFENIAKIYDYKPGISHKSTEEELKSFMQAALPEYDATRVYNSDIKKLAQWYNLLQKAGYITPDSFVKPDTAPESLPDNKPAASTPPKTNAAPKAKTSTTAAKGAPKSTHRKMG